jgi:aryl-alcohol dehydrogenase-like predicted oxidoreductase
MKNEQYRPIGRTGLQVSPLCLGTMTFGNESSEDESKKMFEAARDAGINIIDTANVYTGGEAERITGRLLKECRDEWILTSKFQGRTGPGPNDKRCSRRHVTRAIDATLSRLQTDRIEFYFIHNFDGLTPIEETLGALDDLVRQGKILYPAISNAAAWQIMNGLGISARDKLARFECIQPMYNLVKRQAEVELLPMAQAMQLGVLTYSPIAAGLLTGKYRGGAKSAGRIADNKFYSARYDDEEYTAAADRFVDLCEERGWNPATVAVAWAASHPAVTAAIIGGRTAEQIKMALGALEFAMTPELRAEISALSKTPPLATDRRDEQVGMFIH